MRAGKGSGGRLGVAVALALLHGAVACGPAHPAQPGPVDLKQAIEAPRLPACALTAPAIERPQAFPAAFPLPPGTAVTGQEERSGKRLILRTVVPLTPRQVALFFEEALPRSGYQQGSGESEPYEAEANYSGQGTVGRWKATVIPTCPEASTLDVLSAPQTP
jgi:hypothetical protein